MANAGACAAEDRHSKRAKGSTSDPPPSRPPSPFPDLCYVIDAALEAVEGAGLEPADVPPGEPRTCGSMLMYAFPERCLCIYLPTVCTHQGSGMKKGLGTGPNRNVFYIEYR